MDLSSKSELRPIADALKVVVSVAGKLGIAWFVVGATARDLILSFGYGLQTSRMTRDVDIAVNVESWDDFDELSAGLLEHRDVQRDERIAHRFYFASKVVIDVVPFGSLTRNGIIEWPGDEGQMNMLGFQEASDATIEVTLPGPVTAQVVSLPGLLLLKLVAWVDRHNERPHHDAADIRELLYSYSESWNLDRLYTEAEDLLVIHGYDPVLAGAALLGRDLRKLAQMKSEGYAARLLSGETTEDGDLRLATDMGKNAEDNLRMLIALKSGFDRPG